MATLSGCSRLNAQVLNACSIFSGATGACRNATLDGRPVWMVATPSSAVRRNGLTAAGVPYGREDSSEAGADAPVAIIF